MIAMLGHRGPDGYGLYRDDRVGLAHARLSIIDLAGGFQPIHNEDRTIWLSFNGEIFNYLELRRELASLGHRFYTDGDSEVIVHCYERFGPRAWTMLNGQFAFALWDARRRLLWLVRDRLGILPLHYARSARRVLFGSEVKALFACDDLEPEIDANGLAEVFTRWSTTPPHTVFAGVRSVPPGTALSIDSDLTERSHRYWAADLAENATLRDLTLDEAADRLGDQLSDAVDLRLRADVPVGAYLSGGLDSSVIADLARSADRSPLQTFAVRFADPAFDETAEQRRMATKLGTEHHEIVCGAPEIQNALEDVVWHCEAPLLRTAPVPLFLLSGLVRAAGMKVVLTGEGADELLAGYSIFKEDKVRRFWARQPDSALRPALLARLHPEVAAAGARDSQLWQRFFGRGLTDTDHPFYSHLIRWRNTGWSTRVLSPDLRGSIDLDAMNRAAEKELPADWNALTPLARAQWIEIHSFLSSYLLSYQGDRVAMAHGVEVRYPFLDPGVVEFCSGLPTRLKMPALRDKVTLRRLASRSLPPEIWRRPKMPYRAPMTTALFGPDMPEYIRALVSPANIARLGLVDPTAAAHLVAKATRSDGRMSGEREEMALVGLLTLQLLGQAFFDGFRQRARDGRRRLEHAHLCVLEDHSGEDRAEQRDGQAHTGSSVPDGGGFPR